MKKIRIAAALLALTMTASIMFVGCKGKVEETKTEETKQTETLAQETTKEELKPVTLTWHYLRFAEQKDQGLVSEEINKLIEPKINAKLILNPIDVGSYDQKMTTIIASGEEYDMCWTSPGLNKYYQNVSKGAFKELNELLDKYAPETKKLIPENIWNSTKVNGKIYGIVNYQIMAVGYGATFNKELSDKYNFDWKNVTKLEDLAPMLATIKSKEPGYIPLQYDNTKELFTSQAPNFKMDTIGDQKSPGWIRIDSNELKVINQYETEEFKNLITVMRDYYKKGYVRKDAASAKDSASGLYAIKPLAYMANDSVELEKLLGPGEGVKKIDSKNPKLDEYWKRLAPNIINTDRALATMTAVSSTSQNPERAMMLVELLNTDKKLMNTISFGIENVHYKMANEDAFDKDNMPKGKDYWPQTEWAFGNTALCYDNVFNTGWTKKIWMDANNTAVTSPVIGFSFNAEPVKTQIAQCESVFAEYLTALTSGTIDMEKYLPEFLEKLKKAGSEKVIEEKQKQIDAWKSTK